MYVFSMGLLTKSEQPLRTLCPGGHGSADGGPCDSGCSVPQLPLTGSLFVN